MMNLQVLFQVPTFNALAKMLSKTSKVYSEPSYRQQPKQDTVVESFQDLVIVHGKFLKGFIAGRLKQSRTMTCQATSSTIDEVYQLSLMNACKHFTSIKSDGSAKTALDYQVWLSGIAAAELGRCLRRQQAQMATMLCRS